ncbi:MAG: DinB family protein [Phycisphaerales bacterium]
MPTTAQTLSVLLANQQSRLRHALKDLPAELFTKQPGGDCNGIREICSHLVRLRAFQMMLIGSPLADEAPSKDGIKDAADAIERLEKTVPLLESAIGDVPDGDWLRVLSPPPLAEKWPTENQLARLSKPFNDFTNHIGGIRAIRRILGSPVETTQD